MSVKGQISIPRLELNAARDLAEDILQIEHELDIPDLQPTIFYTDSLDVLAWVQNERPKETPKRYEMSRITYIRKISKPSQWHYIPTAINPADIGTRPISLKELKASEWLTGPLFLKSEDPKPPSTPKEKPHNTNLKSDVTAQSTYVAPPSSYFRTQTRHATEDITSGSMWENLLNQAQKKHNTPNVLEASLQVQKEMQKESWPKGIASINSLPKRERQELLAKRPFLDNADGLIKAGGRLARADLSFGSKHPTLVPDNLTGDALLGYIHANGQHEGRKISSSLIREEGFWPVGGRRRIDRIISTASHAGLYAPQP